MKLSALWKIDATIEPDGSSPIARQLLTLWDHDPDSVRFFRSSANSLYRFRAHELPRFLRFIEASERRREFIEAEMAVLSSVSSAGITVPAPIPSIHDSVVETIETAWGRFHAVVFPALEGEQREVDDLDAAGLRTWGRALGRLHSVMSVLPDHLTRPSWRDHLNVIQCTVPADSLALQAEYDSLARWMANLPMTPDTFGLIHGDFELDNLIWRNDMIGVLDFDDSAFVWYAADVAFAVRDLFHGEVNIRDQRFQMFVEGYRQSHPLSEVDLTHVPLFLRFARLWEYARLMRSLDLASDPTQATWLVALRDKLTRRATAYRASFELQHETQHG